MTHTPYTATGPRGVARVTHQGALWVITGGSPWRCEYLPDGAQTHATTYHETRELAVHEARVLSGVVELR